MKLKATKLFAICLSALLITSLAACAGNQSGETPTGQQTGDSNSTVGETIVFWNVSYKVVDDTGVFDTKDMAINKTIKEFEEANNCKVEIVTQIYDNISSLFKTAGLAQNGPDVAFLWSGGFTNDYREFIEPLDEYFTDEELSAFPDLSLCRVNFAPDGELLGIPTDVTTLNLFYNKDAFEAAGLPADPEFRSLADIEDACDALAAAGIQPFAMADGGGWHSAWAVGEFLTDELGPQDMYKLMDGQIKATDDVFASAVDGWISFTQKGIEQNWFNQDAFTTTSDEVFMPLFASDAAMRFGGSWDCDMLYKELGDRVGTMQIPPLNPGAPYADYITAQIGNNLVVTSYSSSKDLAVAFIKACTTEEFYVTRFEQEGQLPGRIDIDLSAAADDNHLLAQCYEMFAQNKNVVGFDSIMSADGSAEFYRQLPVMSTGKIGVEEGLQLIQEKNDATAG